MADEDTGYSSGALGLSPGRLARDLKKLGDAFDAFANGGSIASDAYRIVTPDGVNVFAYDKTGTSVYTGTDAGAAVTACLPAAASGGATIDFRNDGQVFPWASVPALPKSISRKLLIRGNGSTVQLSASGPRLFDFNKTADYDTFQNITVEDFVIDCNNVAGQSHVVLGTYVAGAIQTRLNFDRIRIRRIRTINVPVDAAAVIDRRNIYLFTSHPAASETRTTTTDVAIEDCDFTGGNYGAAVGGTGISTDGLNVYLDKIRIERCRHTLGAVQSSFFASAGFHIGSRAKGDRCVIRDCYSQFSGDVGFEVDGMTNALVENCTADDPYNTGFYHSNFNTPDNPNSQTMTFRRCRTNLTTVANLSGGWRITNNLSIALGDVALLDCAFYKNANFFVASTGEAIHAPGLTCRRFEINGFSALTESFNYSSGSAISVFCINLGFSGGTVPHCAARNVYCGFIGQRSGSPGALTWTAWNHNGTQTFLVDGFEIDYNVTSGSTNGCHGIDVGNSSGSFMGGTYRRISFRQVTGDTGPRGLIIRGTASLTIWPTTSGRPIEIEDCDFSQFAGTAEVLFASDPQNRAGVFFRRNKWHTFPKASAAMGTTNFAASTFTTATGNQYIGGDPAEIHFATGTGAAITKIEASKDGTTYEEVYAQASGAMAQDVLVPVDNGDYIKVTFATTQPTTRVRPKR